MTPRLKANTASSAVRFHILLVCVADSLFPNLVRHDALQPFAAAAAQVARLLGAGFEIGNTSRMCAASDSQKSLA